MDWVPIVFLLFKGAVLFTGMFFAIKWHYDQDRRRKAAGEGTVWTPELRLFATMLIALTLSLTGIVYAGCWGDTAMGGRGGALAFAFTFFVFFSLKPSAETDLHGHLEQADQALSALPDEPARAMDKESRQQLATLKGEIAHLRAALADRAGSLQREKIYFSLAAITSALAWAYGDLAARWFTIGH